MLQSLKQPEPSVPLLESLLYLVQTTFQNAKLCGFSYHGKESIWSFGQNILLFSQAVPINGQYGPQYLDFLYRDKLFKILDVPLKNGTSLLFFFDPKPEVADDIFATIRFQQAFDNARMNEQSLFLEIYGLHQQVFKYDDIPHYLLNLFGLNHCIFWKDDHDIQNIRRQIGLPLEQLNTCYSVVKMGNHQSPKKIVNNLIAHDSSGKKIYGLMLEEAEDMGFLASLPYPSAIIDQSFLIHAVNRSWHDVLQRTCVSLRTFIPQPSMIKLEQSFEQKLFSFQSAVSYAPNVLMNWHISPLGNKFLLTGILETSQTCTLQHLQSLEENNILLKQFAHLCAHDLKEPLRSIGSYVQLLLRRPERQELYAEFIVNSCNNLKNLIEGILAYASCEENLAEQKVLNMNDIIDIALIYLETKTYEKKAVIKWDPHAPIHIKGNKAQLIQVFQNVIDNALKFATDTPVIHINHRMQNGRHLFSIRDFGIGIPEHLVRKAFALFTRLNDKGKFSGSGIGLALCKKIIEFHKGSLTIVPQNPGIEVQIVL